VRQGFLIPLYNHGKTLAPVLSCLAVYELPVIIVDDGSNGETKQLLAEALAAFPFAAAITLKKNSGKGAAILAGMEKAREMGLSHVLQIDADGQHDADRSRFFLDASEKQPGAAICAYPEYDETAPKLRSKGRNIANTWAKIVTLSGTIADSLCGFRIYPVEKTLALMQHSFFDKRMGFDTEMLVRLYWAGVPLVFYSVKVRYPPDGVSHFRMVADNVRISWTFTRLFFGMLLRLPLLLHRKINGCR
jgi:glycosyltransferase involved in cell wall biosynthesis